MSNYTLGLDLGPNSIGWALIDKANKRIIDLGVRVFPEGVDKFDTAKEESRNEHRRLMRSMRRQVQRRHRRKRELRRALVEAELFPSDPLEQQALLAQDPYELRDRALKEKLARHELGRVFYHLGQHRGFLSTSKRDRNDNSLKGMLAEISQLGGELQAQGPGTTLGQYLYAKAAIFNHAQRKENDHVRARHTARTMYEAEFEAIWTAQQRLGHATILTERLKYGEWGNQQYPVRPRRCPGKGSPLQAFGLYGLLFFQRKAYWPASSIGLCDLEPKQPRCPKADRRAQRFRLLQEVNNLRYADPDSRDECRLDPTQRALLLAKLSECEKLTFDQIRKALGFLESVKFNLEKGKRSYLLGMRGDVEMANAVGDAWHRRTNEEKDAIVAMLINRERDDAHVAERLVRTFGMTDSEAQAALDVDFPAGYVSLSLKAIERLLPHLERGLVYQSASDPAQSALHAAGYLRRDERPRRVFEQLPDPGRTPACPTHDLPNPVVKRTLTELRKVVNAILRTHGRPSAVHVEMGRNVKPRPRPGTEAYRKYQEQLEEMRARELRRTAAAEELRGYRVTVNRDNITRYLLWQDQNGLCAYSGKAISVSQLFGAGEIQVDHILPYSRCLDDSQNNQVVCYRNANADKGNRTPYEWLAHAQPDRYDEVCQRAMRWMQEGRISYAKYRRFVQKELELDTFIERQLNDTRYIARLTAEYLRCLFDADHHVLGVKGQLTAELRHHWGIDNLLAELPDSPAWHEQNKLRPGEKNRADHRHHAIDAVVIALTDRRRLQELAEIRREGGTERTGRIALDPWDKFRDDLRQAVQQIKVSHRAERKVSGSLHEDTFYGETPSDGVWVSRKAVESLSPNEIERIRDHGIQRIIIGRLRDLGIEYGRGVKVDAKTWKQALTGLQMPSGVPIRKVRVLKNDLTIQPIRKGTDHVAYVKPGSTHHLCIFEREVRGKKKREPKFVTMLDAVKRLRAKQTVICRVHPEQPEATFIMSLCRGEMVLANWKGEEKLLVFQTAASTQGQLYFVEHTDARKSGESRKFVATANSLQARKVTVDPLGRVRWARD